MYWHFTERHFAENKILKWIGIVEMRRDCSGGRQFHQIGLRQPLVTPELANSTTAMLAAARM